MSPDPNGHNEICRPSFSWRRTPPPKQCCSLPPCCLLQSGVIVPKRASTALPSHFPRLVLFRSSCLFFSTQKRRGGSEGRRALLVFFSSKIVAVLLSQFIFVRQHRVLCSRQTGRTLGSYPTVFVFASSQKRHNGGSFVSDGRRHR